MKNLKFWKTQKPFQVIKTLTAFQSSKAGSDASDDLLEDDLELLNENTGQTVRGRVAISDDEEQDDRERIRDHLFDRDDYGDEAAEPAQYQREYDEESRSESGQSGFYFSLKINF